MNIAVIGKGAREDAISQKLMQEGNIVYLINENNVRDNNIDIKIDDFKKIKEFCLNKNIELIIVGPEDLLVKGIVNYFDKTNIKIFGPKKEASILESSKIFSKKFMTRNGISTANYIVFEVFNEDEIKKIILEKKGVLVLKYDGLASGKGVFISNDLDSAFKNLQTIKEKYLKNNNLKLIIEDKLLGRELSIMAITDGKDIRLFQASQDYKLSHNKNKGLNTGGMGAITPIDFINDKIMQKIKDKIIDPTIKGFQNESIDYVGFLYFGIMIVNEEPFLLEYNVRLGDPETQVLLPSMKSSLSELIVSTLANDLSKNGEIIFDDKYHISLVLASKGYPLSYPINEEIIFGGNISDCNIYYAGVRKNHLGVLLTNGGRVLNIVTTSDTIREVKNTVYDCAEEIDFKSKYYRDDIGTIY
jgi:phosphoribosylamine--glycine ligase